MKNNRQILVTCALPYANGEIHLGHMLEHIQADIWVRFQRMQGHEIYFICADDAHGTPIMLKAEQLGITPETLIAEVKERHLADFNRFNISFDHYHSTHSEENKTLATLIYKRLKEKGYIKTKIIEQLFDPEKNLFLPDRFVKGICPKCNAPDQYGDNCEVCSATYNPIDLIEPRSVISGAIPVVKESEHYFFDLPAFQLMLQEWIKSGTLAKHVANKMQEWFESGLQMWDISRDAPYFGFEIPDAPDKYFYVWLDAPIGYMGSFKNYCEQKDQTALFDHFWQKNSTTELYHFIGKDIVYFHSLFWPAMLDGSEHRKPSSVFVHGYVTVDGAKMSKSRGTFIQANTYLNHLDPDCLRYYYASKLSPAIDDIDLNLSEFVQKVNTDIVNKIVNLASRTAGFIAKHFNGQLATQLDTPALYEQSFCKAELIAELFEAREFAKAIREILILADDANRYVDEKAPWVIAKDLEQHILLQQVCTTSLNLFKNIMTYLKPVIPTLAEHSEEFLQTKLTWNSLQQPLLGHEIKQFKALFNRIEMTAIDNIIEETKMLLNPVEEKKLQHEAIAETITFDQFANVDLRVALIENAELVDGSDKLVKFTLNIGDEVRTVFSGIKSAYPNPEILIGRLTVMVANLAARKMRFGISEGMVLCASGQTDDSGLFLLSPDSGAFAGMRIG